MAGKEFPISLILKAVDQATAPLRQVDSKVKGLAKSVFAAGKALTVGVTLPLTGLATGSVLAFTRFESGMANIATIVDTSSESIDAMGRQVLEIGKRTPVGVADLTDSLYDIRSAGISAGDQFSVLENSAKLATAGLGTTKESVDLVTSAINAFNLKGEDQAKVYDQIFKVTKYGKTTIAGLAQGFGGVAGTVAAAGVPLDEYLASVAALTTTGLPAATAHTQLKAVISGLTGQTKEAAAIFHRLGVKDFKTLIDQSGGLVPALEKVKGVVGENDTVFLKAVGGAEAFNAAIGLTGNQAAIYKMALGDIRNGTDAMTAAFDKQNATGKATFQRLQNQLEGVAISVGRVLVPVLQQLAPVLEGLAARWENMGSAGQTSIIVVAAAAAGLGPVITILGNLATAVGAIGTAITFVSGWGQYLWMMRASILTAVVTPLQTAIATVWSFTAALLANPITWVVLGFAALAGAAYLIYKNWEPIKEFFASLWETIKHPIDALKTAKDYWFGGSPGAGAAAVGAQANGAPGFGAFGGQPPPPGLGASEPYAPTGAPLLMPPAERPLLGAANMAPSPLARPQTTETRVVVDFNNLPKGTRVSEAPGGTAPLDLSLGYGMMGG